MVKIRSVVEDAGDSVVIIRPGYQRHPDRRHRRPQGHAGGAGRCVPGDHAADLHRAPDPKLAGLRQLEGPQVAGRSDQAHLHGAQRGGRTSLLTRLLLQRRHHS